MPLTHQLRVEDKDVRVSNLDKVFFPKTGFTKGQMIDFYVRIAPVLLPHLRGRAVTLKRYPDGVNGAFFYEKQRPPHAPDWIQTTAVAKDNGETIHYCMLNNLPSLVWAANLANLELHTFLHSAARPLYPQSLVFDLDPGPPADVVDCCEVALWIRAMFDALKLRCFVKTSGSKGLQLVVPLNGRVTYETTKSFARSMGDLLAQTYPHKVVTLMKKELRRGKVFIDWSQNDDKKTTASVYSLRAKETPTVSTPVTWAEVQRALKRREAATLKFETTDVLRRVARHGDLFAGVLTLKQRLPAFTKLAKARVPD